jgi:hypothetical protein
MAKQPTADAVPKVSQLTKGKNRGQQDAPADRRSNREENAHPKKKEEEEEKLPSL